MSRQKRMVHRAPKIKDVIQLWKKEIIYVILVNIVL